ncbi:ATP-binding cassette domain-containing protein [Streptomyces thinghirensis]|nr:ATP-binding cassette domain-containing protein [Streptomyces thinghirensis]
MTALVGPTMQFGQQLSIIAVMVTSGARLASGDLGIGEFAAFIVSSSAATRRAVDHAGLGCGTDAERPGRARRLNSVLTVAPGVPGPPPGPGRHRRRPRWSSTRSPTRTAGAPSSTRRPSRLPRTGLTAIVGPSGPGKTTLLAPTERFLLPESGRISVCGRPVEQWPLHQLRGEISYVDQSFTLVEGTVRQNLQLGRDDERGALPDAELWRALEALSCAAPLRRCRTAWTPSWAGPRTCREASGSGSRPPASCCGTRASSSSTNRPRSSTARTRRGCGR